MHVLVLGGGGREHAIVKALKNSAGVKTVSCAPGNPGIAQEAMCYLTDPTDCLRVVELAKRIKPDVIVIGPELPLAFGVGDALRHHEFKVFGPSKAAALLETSKVFSKEFMLRNAIPTARSVVCTTKEELLATKDQFPEPWVAKADGLAAGKGVRICEKEADLKKVVTDFFEKKILGKATEKVLLEEFIEGQEVSVLCLVAGEKFEILPLSQDHKRLNDNDKGPNTGGMGAFAPVSQWVKSLSKIKEKIILPTLAGFQKENIDYRGVLYFGIIMKKNEPYLLEYNVRFGDPEAQVILPLLEGDWGQVFLKVAKGEMPTLKWKKQSAVCVVLSAPGYPEHPQKGIRIVFEKGKIIKNAKQSYVLHAGTASHRGYFTNGGRVLNLVGVDKTLAGARKRAYDLIKGVGFEGMHFRKDIAGSTKSKKG